MALPTCSLRARPPSRSSRHASPSPRRYGGSPTYERQREEREQTHDIDPLCLSQLSSLCLSRAWLRNCSSSPVACSGKIACTIERRRKFSHLVPWAFVAGSVRPAALAVMSVEEALTPGPCVVLALRVVVDSHRALGAVLDPARNERTNTQRKKRARMRPTRESNQRDAREKN
jgi:hypothetical protein